MKERMHRHSRWVWVLVLIAGWFFVTFAAPKIQDISPWARERPAMFGSR